MNLDLIQTTPVTVKPIIFLVADHRSRHHYLFYDTEGVSKLLRPALDSDESSGFSFELSPCTPRSIRFDRQDTRLKVGLAIPGKPPLQLSFPIQVSEAIRRGGRVSWHRRRTQRHFNRDLVKRKARPGRIIGFVLQESETPALTHTVFLKDQDCEEWLTTAAKSTEASPAHEDFLRIDAFELEFSHPGISLNVRLAAYEPNGRHLFLRDTLTLDPAIDPSLAN